MTLASVILLSAAFSPFNIGLAVFVALAPWLAYLRDCDSKKVLKSGFMFGFAYFLFQMFWIVPFVGRWTGSPLLAAIPWIICCILSALMHMGLAKLIRLAFDKSWFWAIPLVWAGFEGFRSYIWLISFPWGLVHTPLWPFPYLIQSAAYGTAFLVSALIIGVNLLLSQWVWPSDNPTHQAKYKEQWRMIAVTIVVFFAAGLSRYTQPAVGNKKVVMMGQPGVNQAFTPEAEERRLLVQAAGQLQARAVMAGADILILPEGFADADENIPPPSGLYEPPPTPVIFGGQLRVEDKTYQTAFAFDGQNWSYANKTRIVIFGEYVPFREQLPFLRNFNLASGDLTPGTELKQVSADGVKFGPLLCFEGLFPDLSARHSQAGAQALAVMSIDDWYANTPAWDQLWQASVFRSAESGLPVFRAGSQGLTMATDHRGRIMATLKPVEFGTLRHEAIIPTGSDAFGHRFAFVWLCWGVCGFVVFSSLLKRKPKPDPE